MGRNSGSKMMFSIEYDGIDNSVVWYCQQHSMWKRNRDSNITTATSKLKDHLENFHGCVKQ